jgi:hypothetical protein
MVKMRMHTDVQSENLEGRDHLEDLVIGRIILKSNLIIGY